MVMYLSLQEDLLYVKDKAFIYVHHLLKFMGKNLFSCELIVTNGMLFMYLIII